MPDASMPSRKPALVSRGGRYSTVLSSVRSVRCWGWAGGTPAPNSLSAKGAASVSQRKPVSTRPVRGRARTRVTAAVALDALRAASVQRNAAGVPSVCNRQPALERGHAKSSAAARRGTSAPPPAVERVSPSSSAGRRAPRTSGVMRLVPLRRGRVVRSRRSQEILGGGCRFPAVRTVGRCPVRGPTPTMAVRRQHFRDTGRWWWAPGSPLSPAFPRGRGSICLIRRVPD
jgi:hypothetical protein